MSALGGTVLCSPHSQHRSWCCCPRCPNDSNPCFWLASAAATLGTSHSSSQRVLVLGTGKVGIALANEYRLRPECNIEVIGFLNDEESVAHARVAGAATMHSSGIVGHVPLRLHDVAGSGRPVAYDVVENDAQGRTAAISVGSSDSASLNILGRASDLQRIVEEKKINRVVLSLTERRGRMPVRELLRLKFAGVAIDEAQNAFESLTGGLAGASQSQLFHHV